MPGEDPEAKRDKGPGLPSMEPSDRSLLRRFRQGNLDAATQLYVRYAHRIAALAKTKCSRRLAKHLDPDDIVQSVFRRFYRQVHLSDYDVPPGEELWKLFLVIALNKIRSAETFYRAEKRDVRRDSPSDFLSGSAEPEERRDDVALSFLQLSIKEVLAKLPIQHKRAIELRIEGYEISEIAGKLNRSSRTVERILQESRQRLGELLDEGK